MRWEIDGFCDKSAGDGRKPVGGEAGEATQSWASRLCRGEAETQAEEGSAGPHRAAGQQPPPSSTYRGVSWNKGNKKRAANIQKDGKKAHLGNFDDEEEAVLMYGWIERRGRGPHLHGKHSENACSYHFS